MQFQQNTMLKLIGEGKKGGPPLSLGTCMVGVCLQINSKQTRNTERRTHK